MEFEVIEETCTLPAVDVARDARDRLSAPNLALQQLPGALGLEPTCQQIARAIGELYSVEVGDGRHVLQCLRRCCHELDGALTRLTHLATDETSDQHPHVQTNAALLSDTLATLVPVRQRLERSLLPSSVSLPQGQPGRQVDASGPRGHAEKAHPEAHVSVSRENAPEPASDAQGSGKPEILGASSITPEDPNAAAVPTQATAERCTPRDSRPDEDSSASVKALDTLGNETLADLPASQAKHPSSRRQAPRVDLDVDVGFMTDNNFYTGFAEDLSDGGLFIATYNVVPIGTELMLRLVIPGGHSISTRARVCWIRDPMDFSSDLPPGMGLAFEQLSTSDRRAILSFVRHRAPLFFAS